MRKFLFVLSLALILVSCSETEPALYTGNQRSYELFKSSDFDFSGSVDVKELVAGGLEFAIVLSGPKGDASINYPTHLHFSSIDDSDAVIAAMINPVNSATLKSITVVKELSDGSNLSFESFKSFQGHIKVHLASDGPDYRIILVAGNVGRMSASSSSFDPSKVAVCGNSF
ncbi:MAG: hypothetical protein ACI9UV_003026 [Algoriphagus sp.]|jgi:hypothetical protein